MKHAVAILGATGSVGQSFVQLLENHPWLEVQELVASPRSAGKKYGECVPGTYLDQMQIKGLEEPLVSKIVFSGLDASVAGPVEEELANKGHWVISNCRNHRYDPDVPLMIPEVNPEQLSWISKQAYRGGCLITNPNCSVIGLSLSLKPLVDTFGVDQVHVVTLQAISGAGYRARQEMDIEDNVIPYIEGEEEKIEKELHKILGISQVSAHCNRVPVSDGHTQCVSLKLSKEASLEEVINAWQTFKAPNLPSSPEQPIYYNANHAYPQAKHHRLLDGGMAIAIGRARKCSLFDLNYVTLSHNTIRGAAGCAILNAELLLKTYNDNRHIISTASLVGEHA